MPRLEVPTRWSPRRCSQHSFECLFGNRHIAERPHGPTTVHRFIHVHVFSALSANDSNLSFVFSVHEGIRGVVSPARYSYRYFSESASACSMSAIVSSGIRSWASVTSAEVGWASAGSHWSGFQAPLRSSDLGQCG